MCGGYSGTVDKYQPMLLLARLITLPGVLEKI